MRLTRQLFSTYRPPPQIRYGTVTSVSTGICTVQVAGGEIPVITINGAPVNVGDFVMVQRQGPASYLVAVPGKVVWATGGAAYAWKIAKSGAITTYGPFATQPFTIAERIVEGQEGNIWATANVTGTGSAFLKITPSGQATAFSVTSGPPVGITVGPDNNLWAASESGGAWRVGTDGSMALFNFTSMSCVPIVSGPDGNLWVGDQAGGVWAFAPGDPMAAVRYVISPTFAAAGACVGPDDRLWFSDYNSSSIWAVTTSGVASDYPVPGAANLNGLAKGPDGRVWAASSPSGSVYAITTTGAVTAYPLTSLDPISSPQAVCVGPDGRIWVADGANEIWALTTAGVISGPYPSLNGLAATPYAICTGP